MKKILIAVMVAVMMVLSSGCAPKGYTSADVGAVMITYEGEVISTRTVNIQDSGEGTILGAIMGAVVGHQIGGGSGRDVATAAGAIIGGMVGNNLNRGVGQELVIKLENGQKISTLIKIDPKNPFWFKPGDRVRVYVKRDRVVKIEPLFLRD
ncbi:MAG: hypothetical protein C6H99_00590 [Epsilonproteobacteria bacterium]|nr:hypothetical protein [Campylobacterota bacterium]NPA64429.1 glycine zipper 2TM domain-containing protein [Campylobacterota bacterium]